MLHLVSLARRGPCAEALHLALECETAVPTTPLATMCRNAVLDTVQDGAGGRAVFRDAAPGWAIRGVSRAAASAP